MVQVIPAGNQWSMAGSNFGQGISEQIPKEVEHYRLSQGLKNLGQQKNLTPMEYATQAASIYGMTPEMQRQFGQLAREQGNRNSYLNLANRGQQEDQREPRGFKGEEFKAPMIGSTGKQLRNIRPEVAETGIQKTENARAINPQEENKSTIINRNPTSKEQEYIPSFSPERRIRETAKVFSQFPNFTPEQAAQMVAANEESYKSLSEAERKNYDRQEEIQDAITNKFDKAVKQARRNSSQVGRAENARTRSTVKENKHKISPYLFRKLGNLRNFWRSGFN